MRESELAEPVARWLESQGMAVRREVYAWDGTCDLVGCSINPDAAAARVRARRATPLTPRTVGPMLQAGPDWLPIHDALVFVELKLTRMAEVYRQARSHLSVGRSYAALPMEVAEKCLAQSRWERAGIGLLGVDGEAHELLSAREPDGLTGWAVMVVEGFWRRMRSRKYREEA